MIRSFSLVTSQWAFQEKLLRQDKKNAQKFFIRKLLLRKPSHDMYMYIAICNIHIHTYIRLFKAFKNKDKYVQRVL